MKVHEILESSPGLPAEKDRVVGIMKREKEERATKNAKPKLKRRAQRAARGLRGSHGLGHPKGQHWADE